MTTTMTMTIMMTTRRIAMSEQFRQAEKLYNFVSIPRDPRDIARSEASKKGWETRRAKQQRPHTTGAANADGQTKHIP